MQTLLAYVRKSEYSADRNTDREAVARRRHDIQAWADAHGPFHVLYFEDLDVSGRYEKGRPGWADLVGHLDQPGVWGVIVEDWRDSHRNVKEFLTFYDNHLAPRKLRLICLKYQGLDLATADGRYVVTTLMNINEWEAAKSSERRSAAIRFRMETLGRHVGPTPFGTTRDPQTKHLVPSPLTYALHTSGQAWRSDDLPLPANCEQRYYYDSLCALFSLYADARHSLGDVANILNDAGWRHWQSDFATPQPWNRWNTYSVLKRWYLYAGYLLPYEEARYNSRPIQKAAHAPIVPVELAEAAGIALGQRHYARSTLRPTHRAQTRTWLLTGLLFCGSCGQRLSGQKSNGHLYYRHTYLKGQCTEKAILAPPLEFKIISGLTFLIQQPDAIEQIIAEVRANRILAAADNDAVIRLEQRRAERERLIDLHISGLITKAEFTARRDALAAEIARLENETASHPARALAEINPDLILERIGGLYQADPLMQKILLRSFFKRLEIKGGQITAVIPQGWTAPLFDICRLWLGMNSNSHLAQIQIPAWLTVPQPAAIPATPSPG